MKLPPGGRVLPPMDLITDFVAFVTAVAMSVAAPFVEPFEHEIAETFQVAPGSLVAIDLRGGSIKVMPADGRTARIVLVERVTGVSDAAAERARARATVELVQDGDVVRLRARGPQGFRWFGNARVQMRAEAWVPADVRLSLETTGGSISVEGLRTAAIDADTSGGSIRVDGGAAPIRVDTSGGSIQVGHVGDTLAADTSGGSISVDHVDAGARSVQVRTSGGSIRIGVSPAARLAVEAGTSGGRVHVDGLSLQLDQRSRTHVRGLLNGGTAPLRAETSGGSVTISASAR
jgi:hypothetical protein